MSDEDGLLQRRIDARAEGQARINAIGGDVNAHTVYFGDSIETQRQILVSDIEPNLPPRKLELWVDRAQVQAELLQRLDEPQTKLIEVVALGGFGKSSLAVWATEPAQAKGKQVVPVNFKRMPSFSSFGRWVLQELGFLTQETISDDELMTQLVYRLKSKRCLVLMDQLEAIAETKDRETFETFLAQWQHYGQNSTVLITTRQRFLPQEELCLQLPGFTPAEGAAFLQKKEVSTTLADGLPRLSTICNGHPLLLNLSATWLQETKENILDEDGLDFFKKLFKNDLDNPEAQVKEIFEALLGELSETSRLVMIETSVYRIPFDLEMAQAMQPEITIAELDGLEAQGFLLGQESKWRLHPLVGQFVIDKRQQEEKEIGANRKAVDYFEAQLQAETTNIQDYLECFHHYCECQDYEAAYDVIDRCYTWLKLNGYYRILVSTYERLATAWQINPSDDRNGQEKLTESLNRLGNVYRSLGDYAKAIAFQQQSLEIQRDIGNRNGIANSLCNLGNAYDSLGDYAKAIAFQQQSLEIQRDIGDRKGIATSLGNLGNAYRSLGDYAKAIAFQQQSLEITRDIGDRKGIATSLGNLGLAYYSLGDYAKAIDFQQQSLVIQREIGNRNGIAASLGSLGSAYYSLGDYAKAIDFQQQSLEITRDIGDRKGVANSLGNLGLAYYSLGNYAKAIDFQQQSLEIQRDIGNRNGIANSLGNLGSAYYSLGDYAKAIDFQQQSLEITREIGDRNGIARSLGNLGIAYYSLGDYAKAIDFQQQSLEITREIGDRNGEATSLFNLGHAYAKIDEHWKARDSYEQAKAIFTTLQLAHMVEKCETAIQERNRIISLTPKKAPPLPSARRNAKAPYPNGFPTSY